MVISCDDYVDIKTEGKLVPEATENYRYLLNNTSVFDNSYNLVDVASDDIVMRDDHVQYFEDYYGSSSYYRPYVETYKWADSIYHTGETDSDLKIMYSALYYSNVVTSEVLNSNGGTEAEKLALQGEAKVHRAFVFLSLVNIFGKAYDPAASVSDPGIPLLTEPTVDENITRASVQEVYDQVVNDLTDAIASGFNTVNTGRDVAYPSQASAYALLARAYLYMGNYTEALTNAEAALGLQNSLINLEDYENISDYGFLQRQDDPELILSKQKSSYMYAPLLLSLSDDLLNSFDSNDLRYQLYTRPVSEMTYSSFSEGRAYCRERLTGEGRNAGPTVPEMMLIKAECLVRTEDVSGAMATINQLRQYRFKAEDYTELSAADADDALVKVLQERRRELMCTGGFRWADLKRLNKEPEFVQTITHPYLNETYTLEPGGNRYQFPFASSLFDYAPDLEQN